MTTIPPMLPPPPASGTPMAPHADASDDSSDTGSFDTAFALAVGQINTPHVPREPATHQAGLVAKGAASAESGDSAQAAGVVKTEVAAAVPVATLAALAQTLGRSLAGLAQAAIASEVATSGVPAGTVATGATLGRFVVPADLTPTTATGTPEAVAQKLTPPAGVPVDPQATADLDVRVLGARIVSNAVTTPRAQRAAETPVVVTTLIGATPAGTPTGTTSTGTTLAPAASAAATLASAAKSALGQATPSQITRVVDPEPQASVATSDSGGTVRAARAETTADPAAGRAAPLAARAMSEAIAAEVAAVRTSDTTARRVTRNLTPAPATESGGNTAARATATSRPTPTPAAPTGRDARGETQNGHKEGSQAQAQTATAQPAGRGDERANPSATAGAVAASGTAPGTAPATGQPAVASAPTAGALPDEPLTLPKSGDRVTLQLQTENGVEGRLRVALRGDEVHATLVSNDGVTVERWAAGLDSLRKALGERGFTDPRLAIQQGATLEASKTHAGDREGQPSTREGRRDPYAQESAREHSGQRNPRRAPRQQPEREAS